MAMKRNLKSDEELKDLELLSEPVVSENINSALNGDTLSKILGSLVTHHVILRSVCQMWRIVSDKQWDDLVGTLVHATRAYELHKQLSDLPKDKITIVDNIKITKSEADQIFKETAEAMKDDSMDYDNGERVAVTFADSAEDQESSEENSDQSYDSDIDWDDTNTDVSGEEREESEESEDIEERVTEIISKPDDICYMPARTLRKIVLQPSLKLKCRAIYELFFDCITTYMNASYELNYPMCGPFPENEQMFGVTQMTQSAEKKERATNLLLWLLQTNVYEYTISTSLVFRDVISEKLKAYKMKYLISVQIEHHNLDEQKYFPQYDKDTDILFWIFAMMCKVEFFDNGSIINDINTDFCTHQCKMLGLKNVILHKRVVNRSLKELLNAVVIYWNDADLLEKLCAFDSWKPCSPGLNIPDEGEYNVHQQLLHACLEEKNYAKFTYICNSNHFLPEYVSENILFATVRDGRHELLKCLLDKATKHSDPTNSKDGKSGPNHRLTDALYVRLNFFHCLGMAVKKLDQTSFFILWDKLQFLSPKYTVSLEKLLKRTITRVYPYERYISTLTEDSVAEIINYQLEKKFNFLVDVFQTCYILGVDNTDEAVFAEILLSSITLFNKDVDQRGLEVEFFKKFNYKIINFLLNIIMKNRSSTSVAICLYRNTWLRNHPHPTTAKLLIRMCPTYFESCSMSIFNDSREPFNEDVKDYCNNRLTAEFLWSIEDLAEFQKAGYKFMYYDVMTFITLEQYNTALFVFTKMLEDGIDDKSVRDLFLLLTGELYSGMVELTEIRGIVMQLFSDRGLKSGNCKSN